MIATLSDSLSGLVHVVCRDDDGSLLGHGANEIPYEYSALRIETCSPARQNTAMSGSCTRARATLSRLFMPPAHAARNRPALAGQAEAIQQIKPVSLRLPRRKPVRHADEDKLLDAGQPSPVDQLLWTQSDARPGIRPRGLSVESDLPGGWRQKTTQHADGRRLPRPVRPEEAEHLPTSDLEVDAVDGNEGHQNACEAQSPALP